MRSWIKRNILHEKHFERCAESYQNLFEAYRAIVQNGYVSEADWEKIKQAHWIAHTFLPRDIARFTKEWAQKATDAYFLHQKVGRYGHIGTSHKMAKLENVKDESKDEAAIIFDLKGKDPTPIYRKHLPVL